MTTTINLFKTGNIMKVTIPPGMGYLTPEQLSGMILTCDVSATDGSSLKDVKINPTDIIKNIRIGYRPCADADGTNPEDDESLKYTYNPQVLKELGLDHLGLNDPR